ncbi:MAG: c-type cytochrome [Chloroflexi bacterium]|nr:c-type cytochrome [Chloroflexota bacterium]
MAAPFVALAVLAAACGAETPTPECLEAQDGSLVPAGCAVEGQPTATPTPTPGETTGPTAQQLFVGTCGSCHAIDGLSTGAVGPDLTQIGDRADAAYIRESILDPNAVMAEACPSGACPSGVMPPNFNEVLSETEIDALVAFLAAQR